MNRFVVAAILLFICQPAWAQTDCSQTVGATAALVPFPAGRQPSSYVEICDAHASQTVGINWGGGTAAIGSQGTQTLAAGACKKWTTGVDGFVPGVLSVIGSGASTTTACVFK